MTTIYYWSNQWDTLTSNLTSGFTSDKEFNIVTVYIVYRISKSYEKYVKTNAMNTQGDNSINF